MKPILCPGTHGVVVMAAMAEFGRPCDLIEDKDGSLLMSDDSGGRIYRISKR